MTTQKEQTIEQEIEENEDIRESLERIKDHPLLEPIKDQLGCDNYTELVEVLKDVTRGGANAGFSGFTYSKDCLDFWRKNRITIKGIAKQSSDDIGSSGGVIGMIKGFNCLRGNDITEDEIGEVFYGSSEDSMIVDALCWYALEDLAFLADC